MVLSDVLKQIVPCNRQKPYIFISYSSNDKELVWRDALEFQRQGYNIWLDERNLDKTKSSWKEDALLAIQDMYCVLLVFYVSRSSLTSEACYNELAKTVDEYSIALHMGPVKFIAIDVDEVGNIGDFSRQLYQDIFSNAALSKDAKSKMVLTMHNFMKYFFDSNNEKVRVHPKNEPNRKMNYYEEILASFPDEACNREKDKAGTAEKTENPENKAGEKNIQDTEKVKQKSEEQARLEEELEIWKEKAAKLEKQQSKPAEDKKQELDTMSDQPGSLASKMTSHILDKMGEKARAKEKRAEETKKAPEKETKLNRIKIELAMKRANTAVENEFHVFKRVGEVPEKKLHNARLAYAPKLAETDIVGLWDTTVFGSGRTGFLVTADKIYSDSFKPSFIDLNRLESFKTGKKEYHLDIVYEDGKTETLFVGSSYQVDLKKFLTEVLKIKNGVTSKADGKA